MRNYLLLLSIFTSCLFAVVVMTYSYQWSDYQMLINGFMHPNKVWFFGNSVIKHSSKCDKDHRSIAQMLASETQETVIDMSRGGMTLDRMLDITEVLSKFGVKPKVVYFQIALGGDFNRAFDNKSGFKDYFFTNLNITKSKLGFESLNSMERTTFDDKYYGNYAEFSKSYFISEKKQAICPERMGVDRDFIAFMYWRNFLEKNLSQSLYLNHRLLKIKQENLNVVFWVSPVDYEDISYLHGKEEMKEVSEYKNSILESIKEFNVLDLSFVLPASSFADRWCACGHLNEHGRHFVASKLNEISNNENK